MEGLLLIDKPETWTSFDVVNYVRRMVANLAGKKPKNIKVGHCGTLDPFASGLLILLVGKNYTKLASQYSKMDKVYEVKAILGQKSSTGDVEGEIKAISPDIPTKEQIEHAIGKFRGEISQTPPIYSAIKVNGQRAYKLARAGETPVLEPRKVTILSLDLVKYDYPDLLLRTEVSSGTYIRSLIEDIGESLGVGAYTKQLRRTKIANYSVEDAVNPKELDLGKHLINLPNSDII
jgi:tRNA pseudouridine55 synthase